MKAMRSKAGARITRRWAGLVLSPLLLLGCPAGGKLSNPEEHLAAQNCDTPQIFRDNCAGSVCHTPAPNGSVTGVIDLVSPGFEAALVDRPSDYSAVDDATDCPAPGTELIVSTADPEASLLIGKTTGDHACGLSMPPPGYPALSPAALECIRSWTIDLGESSTGTAGAGGDSP